MHSVSPGYSHAKDHKKDSTDAGNDAKTENDSHYLLNPNSLFGFRGEENTFTLLCAWIFRGYIMKSRPFN